MSDQFASSRLPDLPNGGFATPAQREISDAIMFLIRGLERDRLLLLEIVIAGKLKWRKHFNMAYRAIKADNEAADAVFGYLRLLAGDEPTWAGQKAQLEQMQQHQMIRRWDKRFRTLVSQVKDVKMLDLDILKESLKPSKVYSKH